MVGLRRIAGHFLPFAEHIQSVCIHLKPIWEAGRGRRWAFWTELIIDRAWSTRFTHRRPCAHSLHAALLIV